ncbi:hypothetical protein CEXT_238441 [Caerostris extrusa]|uniref:Uncharacterized protein n=1 Tax=Caerostris extrusa TaxID=172846 RepID=A0AAV4T771_CAEEX|nr:hypothetical protein CEXT_238441 [Caerostris extrusa]
MPCNKGDAPCNKRDTMHTLKQARDYATKRDSMQAVQKTRHYACLTIKEIMHSSQQGETVQPKGHYACRATKGTIAK